jgi:uncharacterized protein YchJ
MTEATIVIESASWWLFNNGKLGQWLQPRCVCGSGSRNG